MIKIIIASLIAGVLYTILINIFFKKRNENSIKIYLGGLLFTIIIFILFLLLQVF